MVSITIQCSMAIMMNSVMMSMTMGRQCLRLSDAVLAKTYAKIYPRGGGWYIISGYAADGSDVYPLIKLIKDLKKHHAVLKEGGYYFDEDG